MGPDHQEYYQNNILTGFIVKIEGFYGGFFDSSFWKPEQNDQVFEAFHPNLESAGAKRILKFCSDFHSPLGVGCWYFKAELGVELFMILGGKVGSVMFVPIIF